MPDVWAQCTCKALCLRCTGAGYSWKGRDHFMQYRWHLSRKGRRGGVMRRPVELSGCCWKKKLIDTLRRENDRKEMNFQIPGKHNLECKSKHPWDSHPVPWCSRKLCHRRGFPQMILGPIPVWQQHFQLLGQTYSNRKSVKLVVQPSGTQQRLKNLRLYSVWVLSKRECLCHGAYSFSQFH